MVKTVRSLFSAASRTTNAGAAHRACSSVAFAAFAALGFLSATAHAGPIDETINFSLSGFVDISGTNLAPPFPTVTGSITLTYDPTLTYDNDTTDIVVHSLTGITVDSALGFTYQNGFLEFGGIANDSSLVFSHTNDLVVAFDVTDPSHPKFVPCSTPGYTCGSFTGSSLVEAAGYTTADSSTGWFYGAPQSTVAAVPEPSTIALMGAGLALLGFAARKRET